MRTKLEGVLREHSTPNKLKKYILEDGIVFKDYYYNWRELIENIKELLGMDSEYLIRTLKALFTSDEYDKAEMFFNCFEKDTNNYKKAVGYLIDKVGLSTSKSLRYFLKSLNILNKDEKKNINTNEILSHFYEEDKDDAENFILSFGGFDSSTESGGFKYYNNEEINNYLLMMTELKSPTFNEKLIEKIKSLDYNSNFIVFLNYIEDEELFKELIVDKVTNFLTTVGGTQELKDAVEVYLSTGELDKKFDKLIKKINTESKSYLNYAHNFTNFIRFIKLNPKNKFYQRLIHLSMKIDSYRTIGELLFTIYTNNFTYKLDLADINQLIIDWDSIKYEDIINYLTHHKAVHYYGLDSDKFLKEYLKIDAAKTFKALAFSKGKGLEASLNLFNEFDKEKTYNFVVENIALFSGKQLLVKIIDILVEKKDVKLLSEFAVHKKSKVREIGVTSLIRLNDEANTPLLTNILNNEKSKSVVSMIMEYFTENNIKTKSSDNKKKTQLEEFTKGWFIEKANKIKLKFPYWVSFKDLPKLYWLDGKELTEKDINYFISIASSHKKVIPSGVLRKFGLLISQDIKNDLNPLNEFAKTMYNSWNRESKTKWALSFVAAFGDDSFIEPIKAEILDFVKYGRGAMASQMVEAIAMIGTRNAFQTVDWFSKKVRHKQVKNASIKALSTAALELNISKEELLDKIIPNFGFDESGVINLDYGARNFDIKLNSDLTFLITDNKGKKFKNLPKPGKNDETEIATKSSKFFKELKKEVKNQVKLQKNRLENGFSSNRLWNFDKWSELFIKNPLMKQFALTLLWGNYDTQGNLIKSFRFLEDGSFINIEEEEIVLKSDEKIGLVHPIELEKDELASWVEQIDDYEITQPFLQLNRAVYEVNSKDKRKLSLDDFMGYLIGRSSLKGKLFNKNWNRGSVQDAGCFYEYYKEFEFYGIGVELNFEGDCVGGYDEYGDVPIKEITFYVSNTVQRGSYVYDKPAKNNTFSLEQIPARLYSEVYHEIKTIADTGKGYYEGWEKKEWW